MATTIIIKESALKLEMGENSNFVFVSRFFDDKGSVLFGFSILLKIRLVFSSSSITVGFELWFGCWQNLVSGLVHSCCVRVSVLETLHAPCGLRVVRIDPLRFPVGCHKK